MGERERALTAAFLRGDLGPGLEWLAENLSDEELIPRSRTQRWAWEALLGRVRCHLDGVMPFPPALARWTCLVALGEVSAPPRKPGPKPNEDRYVRIDAVVDRVKRIDGITVEQATFAVAEMLGQSFDTIRTARRKGREVWAVPEGES